MKSANAKPKRKESAAKEKPPGEKRKLCKPLSLSCFTFDEIVETALATKPKKKGQDQESKDKLDEQPEK
jgi:hypothetical protein